MCPLLSLYHLHYFLSLSLPLSLSLSLSLFLSHSLYIFRDRRREKEKQRERGKIEWVKQKRMREGDIFLNKYWRRFRHRDFYGYINLKHSYKCACFYAWRCVWECLRMSKCVSVIVCGCVFVRICVCVSTRKGRCVCACARTCVCVCQWACMRMVMPIKSQNRKKNFNIFFISYHFSSFF